MNDGMKFKGMTTDYTTCMCCGKTDLAQTVVFEDATGQLYYYGTTCATKVPSIGKRFNKQISAAKQELKDIETFNMWISKGYSADVIKQGIFNKFGYSTEVKGNTVYVYMAGGKIALEVS